MKELNSRIWDKNDRNYHFLDTLEQPNLCNFSLLLYTQKHVIAFCEIGENSMSTSEDARQFIAFCAQNDCGS